MKGRRPSAFFLTKDGRKPNLEAQQDMVRKTCEKIKIDPTPFKMAAGPGLLKTETLLKLLTPGDLLYVIDVAEDGGWNIIEVNSREGIKEVRKVLKQSYPTKDTWHIIHDDALTR